MGAKLLFLDLDGVVNNRTTMARFPPSEANPIHVVEPSCVKALNRITETTRALIVVTSTWRYSYPVRSLMQVALMSKGIHGMVEGCTARKDSTRGGEIQAWLDAHPGFKGAKFIVIDDDSDISPFEDRWVHTSFETGLTEADADKAISLLNGV